MDERQNLVTKVQKNYKFNPELGCIYKENLEKHPVFTEIRDSLQLLTEGPPCQAQIDDIAERFSSGWFKLTPTHFPSRSHRERKHLNHRANLQDGLTLSVPNLENNTKGRLQECGKILLIPRLEQQFSMPGRYTELHAKMLKLNSAKW